MQDIVTKLSWFITLAVIPLLSIFGRPLQRAVIQEISSEQLAAVFLTISAGLLGILAVFVLRNLPRQKWIHPIWASLVFIVIPLFLPTVVERLHFIVFGLFGYLSLRSWGSQKAIALCFLAGLLDEILQWWLPDRVGDWRDVGFNWFACLAGSLLAYFLWSRHETHRDNTD